MAGDLSDWCGKGVTLPLPMEISKRSHWMGKALSADPGEFGRRLAGLRKAAEPPATEDTTDREDERC